MIGAEPQTLAAQAGALLRRYRDGDEDALGDLIALLTPILWHTVRAQRLDRDAAEDVLQTTWLALVRSTSTIAEPNAVLQWLLVTARREAWRVVRQADRVEARELDPDELTTTPDLVPDQVLDRADQRRLWQHVQELPERCRRLLRVIAFADRPDYASVAESLGMPIGSVGPTRGRCLAKLRAQLSADPAWETR
ncbi:MAG TPA: sigma-70 family RNA polymerase sigma factor [Jatrophihabitantaceae bacterium]